MRLTAFTTLLVCCFALNNADLKAQMIVAHRGASHDAPENTIAAFKLAWQQNADAVEGDFYLTSDAKIACIHDKDTERVTSTNSKLVIAGSTLSALQDLDVGSWKGAAFADERVPSFEQVAATIPKGKVLFIEIKCGPEIIPALKRALADSSLPTTHTRIISFQEPVIAAAKQQIPDIEAFWLAAFEYDDVAERWSPTAQEIVDRAKAVNADGVDLEGNRAVVNKALMEKCHAAGLGVHVWTINNADEAAHFQELGVDSITTNRPALMRDRLFPRGQSQLPSQEPIRVGGIE